MRKLNTKEERNEINCFAIPRLRFSMTEELSKYKINDRTRKEFFALLQTDQQQQQQNTNI